jgi:hypothetical protein
MTRNVRELRTIRKSQASGGADVSVSWHSLRSIAPSEHPRAVTKHNQSPGMLLNAGSIDRLGDLEINVPIEDFLNAGVFTARPEKLDRVFCNVGRHWPDFVPEVTI